MAGKPRSIVASRHLELGVGTNVKKVTVNIGLPRRVRLDEWMCPFWISRPKGHARYEGAGIDSVQALASALEGARLKVMELGVPVTLPGQGMVNAGDFPQFIPNLLDPKAMTRIEKFIKKEVLRFVRTEKKAYEKRSRIKSSQSQDRGLRNKG